jgi:hypothetical protein
LSIVINFTIRLRLHLPSAMTPCRNVISKPSRSKHVHDRARPAEYLPDAGETFLSAVQAIVMPAWLQHPDPLGFRTADNRQPDATAMPNEARSGSVDVPMPTLEATAGHAINAPQAVPAPFRHIRSHAVPALPTRQVTGNPRDTSGYCAVSGYSLETTDHAKSFSPTNPCARRHPRGLLDLSPASRYSSTYAWLHEKRSPVTCGNHGGHSIALEPIR